MSGDPEAQSRLPRLQGELKDFTLGGKSLCSYTNNVKNTTFFAHKQNLTFSPPQRSGKTQDFLAVWASIPETTLGVLGALLPGMGHKPPQAADQPPQLSFPRISQEIQGGFVAISHFTNNLQMQQGAECPR